MISKNKSKKRKNVGYYRLIYYCLNGTHFGKPQQIQLWKRPTRSLAVRFWVCRAPAHWSDSSLDIIWPCGHIFCYRSRDSGPGSTSQTLTYYFVPPQSTAPPLSSSINLTSNAPLMIGQSHDRVIRGLILVIPAVPASVSSLQLQRLCEALLKCLYGVCRCVVRGIAHWLCNPAISWYLGP